MNRQTLWMGLAALSLFCGGCGTTANVAWLLPDEGGERVYGGVRLDCLALKEAAGGETGIVVSGNPVKDPAGQAKQFVLMAIDLPFSIIGDTLTLPYTVLGSAVRGARASHQQSEAPDATQPNTEMPQVPSP